MTIQIMQCINTSLEKITNKEHNIYVGISVANQYFNKKNTEEYITWAATHSKEKPIILIADELQKYNYQALYGLSAIDATAKAQRVGEDIHQMVKRILEKKKIDATITHIGDITTPEHYTRAEILEKEFRDNITFRTHLSQVITGNLRTKEFTNIQLNMLAKYLCTEIPFQNNLTYKNIRYDIYPYPGNITGKLMDDLAQRRIFPDIADAIGMKRDAAFVEAYVV
jgi:tRNA-dependent cyclodipeptide synthase